ncbi:MAG: TraR/DksA family transcriptional regulator [Gammaproteobacteria bacterium]|nr:TraR/DksA family transcriptional regulator [Gammaproteobacteria bacterium]
MGNELDLGHFRALLEARREELLRDSEGAAAAADTVELDQTRQGRLSRMDAMQQQAMAKATNQRRGGELQRIAAALKRIDDGDYGVCVVCDEPIAAGRLEVNPTATRCIRCAE